MKFCVVTLLAAGLWAQTPPEPATELGPLLRNFAEVFAAIEENAADPVDAERALLAGAAPAMLRKLDPYSVFFDKDQFEQLQQMQRSVEKGFGSVVSVLPGRVFILQVMPGAPSEKAGLQAGDEIVSINGYELGRFGPEQIVQLLSEARQQEAAVGIRRQGFPRMLDFRLKPAALSSPSVERAFLLDKGVGLVKVSSFEEKTALDFRQSVERLGGAALKGLVLDLRGNPGGVFTAALEMATYFLEPGKRIVSVKGRARKTEDIDVPAEAKPWKFPLVLLVDSKSASATEVLAAALQEHGRAVLIGENTYGKGLVQNVYPLSQGYGMTETIAYYYTPKGRLLQRPLQKGYELGDSLAPQTGGIRPEIAGAQEPITRLREFLERNGLLTAFATHFLRRNQKAIDESFEVDGALLDQLREWLGERNVAPSLAEWSFDRSWLQSRVRQEVFNLALGVARGDEIELKRDPQVRRAVLELSR
jgi:carboxyl-terminal processing protease